MPRDEDCTCQQKLEAYKMQYVKFGKTGMDVSRICLGMMSFGKPGEGEWCVPLGEGLQ